MNLHPAIVHFPIALLTLYALFECIRVKKLVNSKAWFSVKLAFLIVGILGSFAALSSGEAIEDSFKGGSLDAVLDAHEEFATLTVWLFGVLAVMYVISALHVFGIADLTKHKLLRIAHNTARLFTHHWPGMIIALSGLITLTITGALGGAMVHGQNVDPVVSIIYDLVVE